METKVKSRWLNEPRGPQSPPRRQEVKGQILSIPVPQSQPNKMSLEQLSGTSAWRKLNPQHKQLLASVLYGGTR
jgi:hypothetical protein